MKGRICEIMQMNVVVSWEEGGGLRTPCILSWEARKCGLPEGLQGLGLETPV